MLWTTKTVYNDAAFFRVVPSFVVQFGIAGTPAENAKWKAAIKDDPVVASNKVGTLTYATAGPNTRTSQLFINLADNTNLDSQGFAPFGRVIKGLDVVRAIINPTPSSSGGVDQHAYETQGNAWIKAAYPNINSIRYMTMVEPPASPVVGQTLPSQPQGGSLPSSTALPSSSKGWADASSELGAARAPTPEESSEIVAVLGSIAGGLVLFFFLLLWSIRAWQCWTGRDPLSRSQLLSKEVAPAPEMTGEGGSPEAATMEMAEVSAQSPTTGPP